MIESLSVKVDREHLELSIDSSTQYASVAVSTRGTVIKEQTWCANRNHSVELASRVRLVMQEAAVKPRDLRAVFVSKGPGGFTSLRVGMAIAKAMALGLNVPIVSVGTLEVEMAPYIASSSPVCALIQAGGGRFYARWSNQPEEEFNVLTAEELATRITKRTVVCGEGVTEVAPILNRLLGNLAEVRDEELPSRHAGTLATIGFERLQRGLHDDIESLAPIYMRSSQYEVATKTQLS